MALTVQTFAENRQLESVRKALSINVAEPERFGSIAAGAGLVLLGASRKSFGGMLVALLGGVLIHRGATGHCALYQQLGINLRQLNTEEGVRGDKGIKVVRTITVARSPEEVYRYWRNLENLPRFMEHVESVRELDDHRSAWVVKGPLGHDVEWTAQIIADREGEMIAWESLPGAEVQNAGSVWFQAAANGATEVKVALQYYPPGGVLGAKVATFFCEAPEEQLKTDLESFKTLLESGQASLG